MSGARSVDASTADPLVSLVDPTIAGHIAVALLTEHIPRWEAAGNTTPAGLRELGHLCRIKATEGQRGTRLDLDTYLSDASAMAPRLLTYAETGRVLSCSDRQVKRLIASGDLRAVRVGPGAMRIRVTDLDTYVERLGADTHDPKEAAA